MNCLLLVIKYILFYIIKHRGKIKNIVRKFWETCLNVLENITVEECVDLVPGQCVIASIFQFLARNKNLTVLEHPPYSPYLSQSVFILLPKIKSDLKFLNSGSEVQAKTTRGRKAINRNVLNGGRNECTSLLTTSNCRVHTRWINKLSFFFNLWISEI